MRLTDFFGLISDKDKCVTKHFPGFDLIICEDTSKKKKNKQKREQKQLDDFCKEYNVDRRDFGDFLERWKKDNGFTGEDTLSWNILKDVLKDYGGY